MWTEIARAAKTDLLSGRRALTQADAPEGARKIRITYSTDDWPEVADGTVTFTVMLAQDGVNFVPVWSDTFAYQRASRDAATQRIETQLGVAFRAGAKVRVDVDGKGLRSSVVAEVET